MKIPICKLCKKKLVGQSANFCSPLIFQNGNCFPKSVFVVFSFTFFVFFLDSAQCGLNSFKHCNTSYKITISLTSKGLQKLSNSCLFCLCNLIFEKKIVRCQWKCKMLSNQLSKAHSVVKKNPKCNSHSLEIFFVKSMYSMI